MTQEIDLRSDTVTKPTAAMRQAMATAEVGDAVIDIDPTVERLEKLTAEILGKESAAFVPSGSMANQLALRVHCDRSAQFVCEADCHIYHYEQGAYAQLSGLVGAIVAGDGGTIGVDQLKPFARPDDHHTMRTQLLCIENTHNRWGGRIQPQDAVIEVCDFAHQQGWQTHLDGARLWNAAIASGVSEKVLSDPFDSVSVCFSKGLGAPVGSAVAGTADFVADVKRARKLFGGGMRQAGIIAAGAVHAIENHRELLTADHNNAQLLGQAIRDCSALSIRGDRIDTNMVMFEIDPAHSNANDFHLALESQGIRCFPISAQSIRLVTHLGVSHSQIEEACGIIQSIAGAKLAESAG